MGGRAAQLKASYVILSDRFLIARRVKTSHSATRIKIAGGAPDPDAKRFFTSCKAFIEQCNADHLPRLAVETSIYFAKIARLFDTYCHATESNSGDQIDIVGEAKNLLNQALTLCDRPFQNSTILRSAVQECIKSLRQQWYEEVTPEEIAAVKQAMVSGAGGIATHSGHWYNCERGHPVSLRRHEMCYIC